MKKIGLLIICFGFAFAGDRVTISYYDAYPTASCQIGTKNFLIPNGTKAEVTQWHESYTKGEDKQIFAQMAMMYESKIKILNGPLKNQECMMKHCYITMDK